MFRFDRRKWREAIMQQENIPVRLATHGIGFRDKFGYASFGETAAQEA